MTSCFYIATFYSEIKHYTVNITTNYTCISNFLLFWNSLHYKAIFCNYIQIIRIQIIQTNKHFAHICHITQFLL